MQFDASYSRNSVLYFPASFSLESNPLDHAAFLSQ